MAGRRAYSNPQEDAPSPDDGPDVPAPKRAHDYDFLIPMIAECNKSNGALAQEIRSLATALTTRLDKIESKLDVINCVNVELGKLQVEISHLTTGLGAVRGKLDALDVSKLETEVKHLATELDTTKDKLDKVRSWVIGAAAVVGALVVGATIGARFMPTAAPPPPAISPAPTSSPPASPPAIVKGRNG
ncbi:hypothetical protein GAY28_10150 [Azospirillum brasilense]|nr:hypothetical protein [Azospirillum brasilense]